MNNTADDQSRSGAGTHEAKKVGGKRRGCQIGCLGVILLFIGFGIFSMYMSTPQTFDSADKDNIIEDINRYRKRYGNWPQNLKELKSKLPDYKFKHKYSYLQNNSLFVVTYQGSGTMGDDYGEFYRSDTQEWKDIYTYRKEWDELESRFLSTK